jgi:hypothetical protein
VRWIFNRILATALVTTFLTAACAGATNTPKAGKLAALDDPPPLAHIHGLGVNPGDDTLYAAAHSGVYKIADGRATIIANRYQDTMGFTVVGRNHFLASGHPDLREELPPLLGLLESRDAGRTWKKKSLLGKADFHALRYAHGYVWGYNSSSATLMVSRDGKSWDARSSLVLRDFVVDPESEDVVIVSNGEALTLSRDGGRTWKKFDSPDAPLLLSWDKADALWLMTARGTVHRSTDSGETWNSAGDLGRQPEAFAVDYGILYAATHSEIFVSRTGGEDWRLLFSPERGTR